MPLTLLDHPIAQHKLGILRSSETTPEQFRSLMSELGLMLFVESTKNLGTRPATVNAPFGEAEVRLAAEKIALIPILRTGLGMIEGIQNYWPDASVGHIGIYRDKFLNNTVEYYFKTPKNLSESITYIFDPIIATGDTAIASIERLKESGAKRIRFVSILASQEGIKAIEDNYPDVEIFTLSDIDVVTEQGYVAPGIGDVGSRYYNTQ
ncbi:uracil phosphoribosyltransferase [Sessilibacter sp. MAH2]